ncbi:ornithine cyclodeaminase family protein [Streptomyces sp. NPDC101132]|uniref:ornithine cyclodeaminase family protein n=1 Tax=Streptomyces sp. NPDC101132 TaxID=3366110 RepID=UPI0038299C0A
MLLLDRETVQRVYPVRAAIPVMAEAMRRYSGGHAAQPLRTIVRPPHETGLLGSMPGHVAGEQHAGFGVKVMALKPENPARGLDLHIGMVIVFDPDTARPVGLLDAGAVTAVRTAAVSAVATDALARPDAGDLAVLGSGTQARSHLSAMREVRELRRVRVWSRTDAHAYAYRDWAAAELGIEVEVTAGPREAVTGADLVCTTTGSTVPLLDAVDLAPGTHVNAVGSSFPDQRELTAEAVAGAELFVDSRESALAESGDIRAALDHGLAPPDHLRAELGDVLLGRHPGRSGPDAVTVYKSLGLGVQDIMSGFAAVEAARAQGLGTTFHLD